MSLQIIPQIKVDFYDKKYIMINAKQYDKKSRFLSVVCYYRGEIYHLNAGEHSAYIRYKKSDNHSVFNFCDINKKGEVIVELTEQMLAVAGRCWVDVVIHENVNLVTDISINADGTLNFDNVNKNGVISTMTFIVDVYESAIDNREIESSHEYNKLNELIAKAEDYYSGIGEVCNEYVLMAQSYAIGGTGKRDNEDTSNARYFYEQFKRVNDSITSGFMPSGTITFDELMEVYEEIKGLSEEEQLKKVGIMYNIKNDFTTNDTFREGEGNTYEAGTLVYYTVNGEWDCLVGMTISIATLSEVEEFLGTEFTVEESIE